MEFYNQSIEHVAQTLDTSLTTGLSQTEAANRLNQYGYNEFEAKKKHSLILKFFDQFKSFMIIVLMLAAVLSGIIGYLHGEGFTDTIIILAIVVINALIGLIQEQKAEKSLEALAKMSSPQCKVFRDGNVRVIESRELVPGDLVVLDTGDSIPADLRLIEAINLKIQDAALTGESVAEEKFTETISRDEVPLGDRDNLGFSSSSVVYGRGKGIVIKTGMETEVGKIASMIQSTPNTKTPLQIKLDKLGKTLGIAALIICAIIFTIGILYGNSILDMLMIAVSLAAAAIPEGLPAVSTIVLSVGVQRMAKQNAIVRSLPSVETLGSTTVICSDKTGTLTQNRMTVVKIITGDSVTDVDKLVEQAEPDTAIRRLIDISILANDAKLSFHEGEHTVTGDPTETAFLDLGLRCHLNANDLNKQYIRVAEIPFDSERKMMSTINDYGNGEYIVATKGGVDEVIARCTHRLVKGKAVPLTESDIIDIRKSNDFLAANALRVLGMAYKMINEYPEKPTSEELENGLVFVGMAGMIDPPREEVKEAVRLCKSAGIKPVMITGDHLITARAIALELGILQEGDNAIAGADVERMTDEELRKQVDSISVYARTSPEHKVRIIKAFQTNGEIVAMTGDGVNDAPALKLADIGTAMGITGTDVSKEAADIVLTDDNFSTIVSAVKEGRRINDNIMKAVEFLLSTNIGELVVLLVAVIMNWVTPLLPIHILWINLVTDSLPALALSVDPADKDIMKRKPVDAKKPILSGKFSALLILQGSMIGVLALIAFWIGIKTSEAAGLSEDSIAAVARTMTFLVLAYAQLIHVFNIRSKYKSAFSNLFSNGYLLLAIVAAAGLMVIVTSVPQLHDIFHVSHLTAYQWGWVVGLAFTPLVVVETVKLVERIIKK